MKKVLSSLLAAALCFSLAACTQPPAQSAASAAKSAATSAAPTAAKVQVPDAFKAEYDKFISAVNTQYAYNIGKELSTNPALLSSPLGGRNAGSQQEHAAADYLAAEMQKLGLSDVEKVGVPVDTWQFNGASLTVDGKEYKVYSYATKATPAQGVTAPILYLGKGTEADYKDIDAKGKLILIDINQREDWWITYPMLEAMVKGAAGIISANVAGFSEQAPDALNAQDICGPIGIPTVSISVNDSKTIQEKLKTGPVTGTLKVDNIVHKGGTGYNVIGTIKGKSSEHQILVGGHYDVHFAGFQDDSMAVGLVLAMAKAMKETGYTPENDIVFILHCAEEWGAINTQYDWCIGAWEMINHAKPEWAGKTLAFLNFELPAYEFAPYTSSATAVELYGMVDFFVNKYPLSPKPEGCFPEGIKTAGYPTYTYSDDFSYVAAGVPSVVNGKLSSDGGALDFYKKIYHSQYDAPETYNEKVLAFNLKYYGAMAMFIDRMPALWLDFTSQFERISASLDEEIMPAAGIDTKAYRTLLARFNTAAQQNAKKVEQINTDYLAAKKAGDETKAAALWKEGKAFTAQSLKAFKFSQDAFLGLMYEQPMVRHQAPLNNITYMQETVGYLEKGDVKSAVDESAWQVNNVLEWYAMYFSPEVIKLQDDMFWSPAAQTNLFWGTGRNFVKADVDAATRSITARYEEKGGDFAKEIAIYKKAIDAQTKLLVELSEKEMKDLTELTGMLK